MNKLSHPHISITIKQAHEQQAAHIASLIMQAMSHECCQNLAGKNHTLHDFHQLMTGLVQSTESQYSYRNCLTAMVADELAGICVAYNGAHLHRLRRAFITAAREAFGIDYSHMADETSEVELYIDSLAVAEPYRRRGIAAMLLRQTIERARQMGIPRVGLLVDKANPNAERLYRTLGFEYAGDAVWGGHAMKHLQYIL